MLDNNSHGWKSRYDYPNMSNVERFMGRKLHVQDNCWSIAKILYVVLGILVVYLIAHGDLSFTGLINFFKYLN